MKRQTKILSSAAFFAVLLAGAMPLSGQYSYYYSSNLSPINGGDWTQNGTGTYGGSASENSLISTGAVPTGAGYGAANEYEVNLTLSLPVSGGYYQEYFRATSNANFNGTTQSGTGTFTLVQLVPTVNSGNNTCTAALTQWDVINGSASQLSYTTVPCGSTMRSVIYGSTISTLINGQVYTSTTSNLGSGQPGFGLGSNPSGNSITQVQLGARSLAVPTTVDPQTVAADPFSTYVDLRWTDPADNTGVGIAQHMIFRGAAGGELFFYAMSPAGGSFTDAVVTQETAYSYGIFNITFHGVAGQETVFNVDTNNGVGAGDTDPRRVGVRSTGNYFGAMGENIDMLSGNLNFTIPLIKAMGRGKTSTTFSLSYNSQMWRQDRTGTWQLGEDIGYGIGFRLQAGSLTPYWSGGSWNNIDHYQFIDPTGAEYTLRDPGGSGLYTSYESIYVTFDRNTNLLHFNDGTSWFMGCVSGGTESDSGTMYPTVVEDSNGNEVLIAYRNGFGTSWPNSSGRIATITDVRSVNGGGFLPASYTFSYANNGSGDPIEHIDTIRNTVGTAENFNFNTSTGAQFIPPFSGAPALPVTTNLVFLTGGVCGSPCAVGSTAPNYTYHFFYDSAEEMTQVVFPTGGDMRWDYVGYTYSDVRTIREVSNRYLATGASGAGYGAEVVYPITHGSDTSNQNAIPLHTTTVLDDPSGSGEKVWTFIPFSTSNPAQAGLVSVFDQRSGPSGVSLKQDTFT
jgi:hypothetical protein